MTSPITAAKTDTSPGVRSWMLRNLVLPAGDLLFRQGMLNRLRFLESAQWWDEGRIAEYRDRQITRLVRVAYEQTAFYRETMREAGLHWSDIRGAADLPKLPIATKNLLRPAFPERIVRSTGKRAYPIQTSGSTGQNFFLVEDYETAGVHRAAFLLALSWAGWRMGERHLQTGITQQRNLERMLKDNFLGCHYFSIRDMSESAMDEALTTMDRHDIRHLWGYPGALYLLARRAEETHWRKTLRTVVTWGDMLYPRYRAAMEAAFGVPVLDTYGCSEGMQIAAQCEARCGYHIHELDVVVECVDETGYPVPDGTPGNLVVTRLHPGPMPLIRYRLGDAGVLSSRAGCACGRRLRILESLQGRDTDFVLTKSGSRLVVHTFNGAMDGIPEIDCYQVRQRVAGFAHIYITPAAGREIHFDLAAMIRKRLADYGAADLDVEVQVVDEIPAAPSGKRRFIISELTTA